MKMVKRLIENELFFRNVVRSRDNWTCQKCGSNEYVQAHHIDAVKDYPLFKNLPDNGITLCVYCHADAHPEIPRNLFIANVIKAKKEGCISAGKLAKELNVNPRTVIRKAIKLGILKPMQKWIFTENEANILRNEPYRDKFIGKIIKRTQIRLDDLHLKQLKCIAVDHKISFTELIRRIIKNYLENRKEKENIILP